MDEGADDFTTTIDWLDDWILDEFKPEMFEELLSDIEDMATNDGERFTSSSSFFGGEPVTLSPSPPPPPLPPQDPTCEKKKRALFRLESPHSTYFPRRSMRLKDAIEKSGTPGKETAEVISKLVFPRRSVRLAKNRNVYFSRRRMRLAFPKRSVRLAKNRNFPRRSMRLTKNRNTSRGGQYHPCGEGRRQPPPV
nr:MAG: hypothetical protein [Chiromantes dehaani nimavirus]